ncbi:MAG: sigma-E processing peptidase SpoIIGA [Oscillospiraceae bacterium]|nr:sigma-E processing peptidase SpoIIGA [Oscillospiraceae bacterium]
MTVYIDGVFLLNFLVDFLLLLAASRLSGFPAKPVRAVLGATLGGVYAACCLLPGFYFLGNTLWRTVSLGLMSLIAFGISKSAMRRGLVFAFLSMALGGIMMGIDRGGFWGIVCGAATVCLLCFVGFRGRIGGATYIPVELRHGDKILRITALQDTGNTLRDPITGRAVLVVGADTALELLGLTRSQLQNPVQSISALPGLRLIPYHSVGASNFLLAMKLKNVRIGNWQGSTLVAFAPESLSAEGAYQALTGGV